MLKEFINLIVGSSVVFAPVITNPDVVVRVGEYENKPGKRIYVEESFHTPDDIPLRHDSEGYYISEYDLNLKLATKLKEKLQEKGINVDLQISKDRTEDLNAAGREAMSKNPKIYFSIHHNSFKPDSSGYLMLVNQQNPKEKAYAKLITDSLKDNPGHLPSWGVREQDGYIGEMNETSSILNFLFEAGFFSNKEELQKIMSDEQVDYVSEELSDIIIYILENEK